MKVKFMIVSALMVVLAVQNSIAQTHGQEGKKVFITVDADSVGFTTSKFGSRVEEVNTANNISVLKIDENALPWLSLLMHRNFKRCGGFMLHNSEKEALNQADSSDLQALAESNFFAGYSISRENEVRPIIDQMKKENIFETITKLSSFQNRYYKGQFGKQSATWIKDYWSGLVKNRSDASVEFFNHSQWDQPSVILTIKGETDNIIIIGGHQDSINGYFGGNSARAPGSDDNASGIATITEVIRTLVQNNYKPKNTIKFMAYAAEEVGLLGSKEIATKFKQNNARVIGVMQLDMTNFKGTKDLDIVMMTDYTNSEQNKFVGNLIDTYVSGVKWGFDKCGYGCSDHASWFTQGYPTSMPFESKMGDMNHNIHTANDTLDKSNNNADHAIKFGKMAIAYIIELDK